MSAKQRFQPHKFRVQQRKIVAFDVEGDGREDGFICGSVYDNEGSYFFIDKKKMGSFLLRYSYRNAFIYANNLQYDLGILYQPFSFFWKLLFSKSRLIWAKHIDNNRNRHIFLDACNITANLSIERMGKIINLPKLPIPQLLLDFSQNNLDKSVISEAEMKDIKEYNIRDSEILFKFISMFQQTINDMGSNIYSTSALTSLHLFQNKYLTESYFTPYEFYNDLGKNAYYGGRVEVFKKGKVNNLYYYDINSMYPYIMLNASLPHPNFLRYKKYGLNIDYIYDYEGITKCEVSTTDDYVPILPLHEKLKLYFKNGKILQWWANCELREALKQDYRIKNIECMLYSERITKPFQLYIEKMYSLRRELQKRNDEREVIIKIMMNSLYGKFGQNNNGDAGILRNVSNCKDIKQLYGKEIIEWFGELYIIDELHRKYQPYFRNVLWSLYITALGRIYLLSYLKKYEKGLVYCDTDSFVIPNRLETSDRLGDVKMVKRIKEGIFLYPKMYYFLDEKENEFLKVKGVPSAVMKSYFFNGFCSFKQPCKIKSSIKRDFRISEWIETEKKLRNVEDKRRVIDGGAKFFEEFSETEPFVV